MKSVGEVMAIGRNFAESLQKALASMETGLTGLDEIEIEGLGKGDDKNAIKAALGTPTPDRLLKVAQALRLGFSKDEVYESCKIDWLVPRAASGDRRARGEGAGAGLPRTPGALRQLKAQGFSDARLAVLANTSEAEVRALRRSLAGAPGVQAHRHLRGRVRLARPPTCTRPMLLPSPEQPADEAAPSDARKVVILAAGRTCIGQGFEFDYCCCHACFALKDAGFEPS
jgi:carbamoyl-phosphate synthase large subunit